MTPMRPIHPFKQSAKAPFEGQNRRQTPKYTRSNLGYIEVGPVVAGGTVYVGSDDGKVYALGAGSRPTPPARW